MRIRMRRPPSAGFTLLEVLIATAIMAIGTLSVLIVIATAAGMASRRTVDLRLEQVVEEARREAQAQVNRFRPVRRPAVEPAAKSGPGAKEAAPKVEEKLAPDDVTGRTSSRFAGFAYDVAYRPKDPSVPEKGYDVTVRVHYGDGLERTATTSVVSTLIPDEEFTDSETYRRQREGLENRDKPRETR